MPSSPPARVRWASRALLLGAFVFAVGVVVFGASRLGLLGRGAAPTPSAAAVVTPAVTQAPTPEPTVPPSPTPSPTPGPSLEQLIGQKLVVRMDGGAPSEALLRRAARGEIGGVVLFRTQIDDEPQLRAAAVALQAAAKAGGQPPLLLMVDQEGGGIRTLRWAQPEEAALVMGRRHDADAVRSIGAAAGKALVHAGLNVDLAPVADVPGTGRSFMRDSFRTFSDDPSVTSDLAVAFAQGLASQDVLATAKHFPGIGRVARNTDRFVETVTASREALDRDLEPFRALIGAGVPLVMLSNATYEAWDPDNAAAWSHAIAQRLLRDELGFTGVTVTDSLSGTAAARDIPSGTLALAAARAGVDLIMVTGHEGPTARVYERLLREARAGSIDRAVLEASLARILALKATLGD